MSEMKLTDLSFLRALMARHGISAQKKYGQNFLINPAVPARIAGQGCPPGGGVIEIGPGMGTLTRELCLRAPKVVCLEIDARLLPVLDETLADFDNVKVLCRDALKTDLPALVKEEFGGFPSVSVCANLPYYITTPIVMALLESGVRFERITVMVQKEVADRLTASAGSPEYGAITAAIGCYGKAEKLFTVSPGSFYPAPTVDSCVMQIVPFADDPFADCDRKLLSSLIRAAFEMRRKTLQNNLKGLLSERERKAAALELSRLGFPPDVRGERLSSADFAVLCRAVMKERE